MIIFKLLGPSTEIKQVKAEYHDRGQVLQRVIELCLCCVGILVQFLALFVTEWS